MGPRGAFPGGRGSSEANYLAHCRFAPDPIPTNRVSAWAGGLSARPAQGAENRIEHDFVRARVGPVVVEILDRDELGVRDLARRTPGLVEEVGIGCPDEDETSDAP
jgi:hypothetical protein